MEADIKSWLIKEDLIESSWNVRLKFKEYL